MQRTLLNSSNVHSIGYDPREEKLEVAFHSGRIYEYEGCPTSLFLAFLKARSPGRFFLDYIRDRYVGTRIDQQEAAMAKHKTIKVGGIFTASSLAGLEHESPSKPRNLHTVPEGTEFPYYSGSWPSVYASIGKTLIDQLEEGLQFIGVDIIENEKLETDQRQIKVRMTFQEVSNA